MTMHLAVVVFLLHTLYCSYTTTNEHKNSTTNVHTNTNMSTNHIIIINYCKTKNMIF